jgi:ubiquinone/menaquinone biosynthesis C-methylase UbiE
MNATNRGAYERVFRRLDPEPGGRILEVGCGNGRFVPLLLEARANRRYVGIDISRTMVEEAARENAALVVAGRAAFCRAAVEALPFPDASLDHAFAVAVVYFWPDPARALVEIRRVLRPGGGVSILASMRPETAARLEFARPQYGFHVRDEATVEALCREAGFRATTVETYAEVVSLPDGATLELSAFLAVARV